MEAVNQRERVSLSGWRSKDARLIELGDIRHWRTMRDTSGWVDVRE
jgi:hypothetical protein